MTYEAKRPGLSALTGAETALMRNMVQLGSISACSRAMGVRDRTLHNRMKDIREKLHCASTAEAVALWSASNRQSA